MSDKKHIDRLFQEKLKDFELAPDDSVWDAIHAKLHTKEDDKRRIIPLWWKLGGVAALLALLLTVGIRFMSNDVKSGSDNSVVGTEKQPTNSSTDGSPSDAHESNVIDLQTEDKLSQVVDEDDLSNEESTNSVSTETVITISEKNKRNKNSLNTSNGNQAKIVTNSNKNRHQNNTYKTLNEDKNQLLITSEQKTNAVSDVSDSDKNTSNQNLMLQRKEPSDTDKLIKDSKNINKSAATNASDKMEDILTENKEDTLEEDKSIEDALAEANTEEEKDEKEKKLNRWNISPNVAPVYFNSLGKGSTLDEQFVNNTNQGDVTMSYGLGGSYAINDRVKLRAGINKVDMGYNTKDVIAFRSIDANSHARARITNISTNGNAENITFLSAESLNRNITPEIINTKTNGAISQRFGFIEVPMEVEYALVNQKFGVNVIGGFSTLIVDKNEVYSIVDGAETRIGEANNINNMSYSANFGLGINYNVSEKIKVNVEPTFKYQINTFNNSSGDFQPYFIGVYTGLSYKF